MNISKELENLSIDKRQALIHRIETNGEKYGLFSLTKSQYGLWCTSQIDNASNNNLLNMGFKIDINGNISIDDITRSIDVLCQTHEVLRYRFIELNKKVYQYIDTQAKIDIYIDEHKNLSAEDFNKKIKQIEYSMKMYHYNLREELPFRVSIISNDDQICILFSVHHIVCDAWSIGILINDFLKSLDNETISNKVYNFTNHIRWEHSNEVVKLRQDNVEYWKNRLKDFPQVFDIPENSECTDRSSSIYTSNISGELMQKVKMFSIQNKVSVQSVLLAAFLITLSRYSNENKINIGMTTAGRNYSECLNCVGNFASVLILPLQYKENLSVLEFVHYCSQEINNTTEHQETILADLIDNLVTERQNDINPIYQVMFAYHSRTLLNGIDLGNSCEYTNFNATVTSFEENKVNNYPLYICTTITENSIGAILEIEYANYKFTEIQINNIASAYMLILENILINSDIRISNLEVATDTFLQLNPIDYIPLKLLYKVELNKNIHILKTTYGNTISLSDSFGNNIFNEFLGNINVLNGDSWFYTGQVGRIHNQRELYVLDDKSQVFEYKGNIINKEEYIKPLKSLNIISANLKKYKNILLLKCFVQEDIPLKDISSKLDILPDLISVNNSLSNSEIYALDKVFEYSNIYTIIDTIKIVQKENDIFIEVYVENLSDISQNVKQDFLSTLCFNNMILKIIDINGNIDTCKMDTMNDIEKKIFNIWKTILGHSEFNIYSKFYEIGGNSMNILKMLNMVNSEFNININIAELFEYNTIQEISQLIQTRYQKVILKKINARRF